MGFIYINNPLKCSYSSLHFTVSHYWDMSMSKTVIKINVTQLSADIIMRENLSVISRSGITNKCIIS